MNSHGSLRWPKKKLEQFESRWYLRPEEQVALEICRSFIVFFWVFFYFQEETMTSEGTRLLFLSNYALVLWEKKAWTPLIFSQSLFDRLPFFFFFFFCSILHPLHLRTRAIHIHKLVPSRAHQAASLISYVLTYLCKWLREALGLK